LTPTVMTTAIVITHGIHADTSVSRERLLDPEYKRHNLVTVINY